MPNSSMMSTLGARYGQGDSQVCLSYAWCAQQQEVGGVRHEGHARQLPDLALVDGGLEAEVELLQGTMEGQVGPAECGSSGISLAVPAASMPNRSASTSGEDCVHALKVRFRGPSGISETDDPPSVTYYEVIETSLGETLGKECFWF